MTVVDASFETQSVFRIIIYLSFRKASTLVINELDNEL